MKTNTFQNMSRRRGTPTAYKLFNRSSITNKKFGEELIAYFP
jgi:hypothetical protein